MVKKAKLDVNVVHSPVTQLTEAADVVVTHQSLAAAAKTAAPGAAIIPFMLFMNDPAVKGRPHPPRPQHPALRAFLAGISTSVCSKTVSPFSLLLLAVRNSHST